MVFIEDSIGNDTIYCKWTINQDSSLICEIYNDSVVGKFISRYRFITNSGTNEYSFILENSSTNYFTWECSFKKNSTLHTKVEPPVNPETSIQLSVTNYFTLHFTESLDLTNYINLAEDYIMVNYPSSVSDLLSFGDSPTGPPILTPQGEYHTGCLAFWTTRSIAKHKCRGQGGNILLIMAQCQFLGMDCACIIGDVGCVCQSAWYCEEEEEE